MPPPPAIELVNVWKVFGRRIPEALQAARSEALSRDEILKRYDCVVAVADANMSIAEGEIFCIMGLSGSGKSTLIRHVNRLIEPTDGSVKIHGEDISRLATTDLRKLRAEKIGMVFQHVALFPHRRIWENVAFGLEVRGVAKGSRKKAAAEKLALVQLNGWEDRYPNELSGGMQQRVGLARALAADPGILLMDEPFSALDPLIRRQLQDEFLQLASVMRKTTLFITHDLDEAVRLGDRIAIMKDGRFIQSGTAEDIVTRPADAYVEEFVRSVSRLKIIRAGSLMKPITDREQNLLMQAAAQRRATVTPDTDLDQLIRLKAVNPGPLIVIDEQQRPIGLVEEHDIFRAIHG